MMAIELLNYETSILNPLLKLLNTLLFGIGVVLIYLLKKHYSAEIKKVLDFLFLSFGFFALGALLRYFGHGEIFGFTNEFSLKWFQSLGYIVGGIFFILSARALKDLPSKISGKPPSVKKKKVKE